jgi:hypothetical protein
MAKKKLIESIVDFIEKPAKEIKKIKRQKQFDKKMNELKNKDEKFAKSTQKRNQFFTQEAKDKRLLSFEKDAKELASRMERDFAKSKNISPRKMRGGGIAVKGHGKAFVKGRK